MMRTRATTSSSVGGFQPVVRVVSLISGGRGYAGDRGRLLRLADLRLAEAVGQNGSLLSRRGRSVAANASGLDTHRDSITSRFGRSIRGQLHGGRASCSFPYVDYYGRTVTSW
jgi:hypothetical protein